VAKHKKKMNGTAVLEPELTPERPRLTEMVPVRFPPEVLHEVRNRAVADDRSVSAWIRRAVERELRR
jgi:predicted HicB family RNase H-like nuclease